MDRAIDGAIDHDVRRLDFAIDARVRGDDQRAGLACDGADVAADHAVHAQPPAENHVALDARRGADQAVDPVLRLARRLVEHACSLTALPSSWRAAGWIPFRRPAPGHSRLSPWGSPGRCPPHGGST